MKDLDQVTALFTRIERLSTAQLHQAAENLVQEEKVCVATLIAHLSEISRRKTHLELGYGSLWDYCVRHLGLSEGSTSLRIQVARVSRLFPQILQYLAQNKISLTVAGLLSPHLSGDNAEKLLFDCARKTKRETEEYLVSLKPKPALQSQVRKAPDGTGAAATQTGPDTPPPDLFSSPEAAPANDPQRDPERKPATSKLEPASPENYNFRFAGSRGFKEKIERLAEVLGIPQPQNRLQEVLEKALDFTLP